MGAFFVGLVIGLIVGVIGGTLFWNKNGQQIKDTASKVENDLRK